MSKYTRQFVDNCFTCKLSKSSSGKVQAELHPIPRTSILRHTGKPSSKDDSKAYVLVDPFTKYVYLYHTWKIDSLSTVMVSIVKQ